MFGLIARADNRGLGQQTWAVHRNLKPAKTLVVDCPSMQPLKTRFDRFPDATVIHGIPDRNQIREFLDGLTAVYTAETGYTPHLWSEAEQLGVTTVLHANYEFLDRNDRPTVWAAPSVWHIDDFPPGTVHLPVPIETDRFPLADKPSTAKRFLHVVGRPAIHDRNGTVDFLQALGHVTSTISVTVTCQQSGYIGKLMNDHHIRIPSNIDFTIKSVDAENYWENYTGFDALVLPRRFGGLCLPANEAIGAGMPVIMPNICPNSRWLPESWRVPATFGGEFRAKQHIKFYRTDPVLLAGKMDELAQDEHFYSEALTAAQKLRGELSWEALKPAYRDLLQ